MIKYSKLLMQSKPYKTMLTDKTHGMLGHCYMLICDDQVACSNLCTLLARLVLCDEDGCGVCRSCIRVDNDSHTELIRLTRYNADSVRDFVEYSYYSIGEGKYKVMLIDAFDKIEPRLQNTLLKTLEEPCDGVVFILGTTKPSGVLATIKSRAKKLYLDKFDDATIALALRQEGVEEELVQKATVCASGSLGRAEKIAGDPIFIEAFSTMIDVLTSMKSSKDVVNMLAKMRLNEVELSVYLDALEIILQIMLSRQGGKQEDFEDEDLQQVVTLSATFNNAMIVNVHRLVCDSRKKLDSNCRKDFVADRLLMGILEVKYICRL
ncbi:MAG: hypothetical protein SO434_05630 [Eubacteriales bacterium]|nr:hypothetical protein [Eubacteriales bacterium]